MNCDSPASEDDLSGVAIIGMAGRFPGATDVGALWKLLVDGQVPLHEITDDELEERPSAAVLNNPDYVRKRLVLEDSDKFDARFFGYSPREAALLDPQQRLFLEVAWSAMENAGYVATKTSAKIGVFASANFNTYAQLNPCWPDLGQPEPYMDRVLASDKDYIASRCAYKFDLHGPALTVQTACSSSLTAVALACNELLTYGCDMALAGGAGVSARQLTGYLWRQDGPLAKQGRCLPFDAQATGMIDSSGVAAVILKRLTDAVRDGDTIYAVIAGSGMSNDGARKSSFTAPGVDGQIEAIRAALEMAGITGKQVSYVETHGTGTPMGDPVEVSALKQALGNEGEPCVLGALKANIGHMGAAAGIGGLIKAALALHHELIPPHPTFQQANPACQLEQGRFSVNRQAMIWQGLQRYAGVSSFGLGGSNVHLILRPAPVLPSQVTDSDQMLMFTLSARREDALEQARYALVQYLSSTDVPLADISSTTVEVRKAALGDVAYTLHVGRKDFDWRLAACARDRKTAIELLTHAPVHRVKPLRVAWLFAGAGLHAMGMGKFLYQQNPRFRATIDQICQQAIAQGGRDPRSIILAQQHETMPDHADALLISLFAVEMALACELQHLGVQADILLGHSFGEYAVACLAGVFNITTAIAIIYKRAQLIERTAPGGMLAMAAVNCSAELLATWQVDLAVVNGEQQVVVSGTQTAIDGLHTWLTSEGVAATRLPVSRAGHSSLLEPILAEFATFLEGCQLHPANYSFISSRSGDWVNLHEVATVQYWVRHLRDTVQFTRSLDTLFAQGAVLSIEIGSGRGLSALVRRHAAMNADSHLLTTNAGSDGKQWYKLLADLWSYGKAVELPKYLLGDTAWRRVPLPTYAFARESYWQEGSGDKLPSAIKLQVRPCEQWLVYPMWAQYPLDNVALQNGCHLILGPDSVLSSALRQQLEVLGASVVQTEDISNIDKQTVFQHIWFLLPLSVADRHSGQSSLDYYQTVAQPLFERLLALIRQFAVDYQGRLPALTVAGSGIVSVWDDETSIPELAILLSLLRTLPHEFPASVCRYVDIEALESNDVSACAHLLLTLISAPIPATPLEQTFAIRRHSLWRKEYREAPAWQSAASQTGKVRSDGCYLILGGIGGIGLSLAHALAQQSAAHISLVGYHPLEGERLARYEQAYQQLQAAGTQLHWLQADLADPLAVREIFRQALTKMGRLNGVIHAAGVAGGGLIQAKLPEGRSSNLGPKILALLTLEPLLGDQDLDFLLLCSSIGAHTGATGQLDNVMGNSFFDSYASAGRLPGCRQVISIGWDYWQQVGMIKTLAARHREFTGEDIEHGMTPQQGNDWFLRLLGSSHHQVLISTLAFTQIQQELRRRMGQFIDKITHLEQQKLQKRIRNLDTPMVVPEGAVEQLLCYLWGEQLGLSAVGSADNYLDLGGDSLRALTLLATMKEALGTEISVRALYQNPTPGELAAWLLNNNDAKTLITRAELYLEICSMSADEVSHALHEEQAGV